VVAKHDYRATVLLPKTDFPMRANLPKREKEAFCVAALSELHAKLRRARQGRPKFVLHDGPPYANGRIHIGHAVNKVLKDFVVRSRFLMGMDAPFVPGWDCHGLPIELKVEEMLGGKDIDPARFRAECRRYAEEQLALQREDFARLGVLGDWHRPYLTMDPRFEADTIRELGRLLAKGAIYRGAKPVHWCIRCKTALAEAEIEYETHRSPSIFVKFPVPQAPGIEGDAFMLVWTTTPWTLPANRALAVHPSFRYAAVRIASPKAFRGEVWLIAKERLSEVLSEVQAEGEIIAELDGAALTGQEARHPYLEQKAPILAAEFVTLDAGTGIVHIAPGHGEEDYQLGRQHGIEPFCPVDDEGVFAEETPLVGGLSLQEANRRLIDHLSERGALVHATTIEHSYPHCWRCHRPVIFRATPQWFVAMDKGGLREQALAEIERVRWWPSWGKARIRAMVEQRPDWCISRQRHWGTPIAIVRCASCGSHAITTPKLIERIASIVEKEGADAWFTRPLADFVGEGARCPDCGSAKLEKETDILDVWFDSGSTHACVLETRAELAWPADLYLEGSDQHRGWFQSSLLEAVATRGKAPYRGVLTHGFVVDEKGEKMSKSRGNVVAPQEVIERYGAEILRLWVAASDYTGDLRISEGILAQHAEAYRRIRNTIRFLLGNLHDFDPKRHFVAVEDRSGIDRWALWRTAGLNEEVRKAYEAFQFSRIYHAVVAFCTSDLSGFYLDVLKDRLYCDAAESRRRRAAQSTLWQIARCLLRWMAPILPFTTDEAWKHLVGTNEESVHLSEFEALASPSIDEEAWQQFFALREEVNAALDAAKKAGHIGASAEAAVVLACDAEELASLAKRLGDGLAELLLVSEVLPGDALQVRKASGVKCPRCWQLKPPAQPAHPEHPQLCPRCFAVVAGA